MRKYISKSVLGDLITTFLFVSLSAIIWYVVNNFEVAHPEGFDPFRYEYFARSGLPEFLQESNSYNIVLLLTLIYRHLPFYIGFIVFIGFCLFLVLSINNIRELRYAIFSPIAFFYIAQTGKDGLSILAIACVAIFATQRFSIWHTALVILVSIALFVRPALILFLPLAFISIRFGNTRSIFFSILLAVIFLVTSNSEDDLFMLESVVSNEGSGLYAQLSREMTFGYSPIHIFGRLLLLFVSPFIQPVASVVKLLSGADLFVLFEGFCQLFFFLTLIRYRIFSLFIVNSIPFLILVATISPFYHFRYMAITYPIIFLISILAKQNDSNKLRQSKIF